MVLVRVLKRRDAASVIVAVVVAMILYNFVMTFTGKWAANISGLDNGQYFSGAPGAGWQGQYLYPAVWAVLELLALEVLGWIWVWTSSGMKKK